MSVLLLGCNSPLPIEYETDHLRIGTDFDYPLCEGNLHSYEQTIAFIEDDLGIALERTVDLFIWSDEGWKAGGFHHCGRNDYVFGCYSPSRGAIYTSQFALEHELTHAIIDNTELHDFFSEGMANAYSFKVSAFGSTAPSANEAVKDREHLDSLTATHFIRWLRERWGGAKLGALVSAKGSPFDNFEAVYGVSFVEAEALYFAEVPSRYPSPYPCDSPEILPRDSSPGWVAALEFDCGQIDTSAWPAGLWSSRTVVIDEPGEYSFATDAAWIDAYRCADEHAGPDDDYQWWRSDGIPVEYASYPSPASRPFEGGVVHTVTLQRGRYNFRVAVEGFGPQTASIAVWPSLSPGPVEPSEN